MANVTYIHVDISEDKKLDEGLLKVNEALGFFMEINNPIGCLFTDVLHKILCIGEGIQEKRVADE